MDMATGTALIYDEEMTKYKLLWVDPACKIEVPERLTVSYEALVKSGLADRCVAVPVREATDGEILLAHSEEYLDSVKKTPDMSLEELITFTQQYGDVYFHPNIFHCAKLAIGATLQLVDRVMMGKVRNGMALVRPPGHHSQHSAASGFCVFNNVAIAAKYAMKQYDVKRVLIVDWDVHHGQGVQYCFEDNPSVLYFSWHRYEHQRFWPNLKDSDYDSVGKDKGTGFNINVPWNKVGMENSDYLAVFFHVLLPVAYEFSPDLVLVCAGFDSAIGDPELKFAEVKSGIPGRFSVLTAALMEDQSGWGRMCATPDIFSHLTHLLMNLTEGKLCLVLEGGYNLTSLAQSVCQTVQTLLGDPAPPLAEVRGPCESALESIHCVRSAHKQYWSCFSHAADIPASGPSTKHSKVAEQGHADGQDGEGEKETKVVWPEPPHRLVPPVCTAVILPSGTVCPDACELFSCPQPPDALTLNQLGKSKEEGSLTTLYTLLALLEQMEKNEVRNGLAALPDVSMALTWLLQHTTASVSKRVLLVCVGDSLVLPHITEDGRTLLVHFSSKQQAIQESKYYIPLCLKKGYSDSAGFIAAVLGLLLPLAYEYNPSLVLLVPAPGTEVCYNIWQQLTSLMQGVAQGHTLVLMQENDEALVGPTASILQGSYAPSLGTLGAPLSEDVEALERLRHKLCTDWKLLHTTAPAGME